MPSEKVTRCVQALIDKKLKIAFAESASAGRLSLEFSRVVDSGQILLGSVVCYDALVKQDLMQVPKDLIDQFTAESAEVTQALAQSLNNILKADVSLALTGLTSPGGSETPEKPVGTIFLHCISAQGDTAQKHVFSGSPDAILDQAVDAVAQLILEHVTRN